MGCSETICDYTRVKKELCIKNNVINNERNDKQW